MKFGTVKLTGAEWRRIVYAVRQQVAREAEIVDCGSRLTNVLGPEFEKLADKVDYQTQEHLLV